MFKQGQVTRNVSLVSFDTNIDVFACQLSNMSQSKENRKKFSLWKMQSFESPFLCAFSGSRNSFIYLPQKGSVLPFSVSRSVCCFSFLIIDTI